MPARPKFPAAALLAALALLLICSMPADASARSHRHHGHDKHRKVARWTHGKAKHRTVVKAPGIVKPAGTTANAATSTGDPKFGVFTDGAPYDGDVASVDALQSRLGRHIDIVNWYQSWTPGSWAADFHADVVGAVTGSGRTPLLTWEPWDPSQGADQPQFRLRKIADGAFDRYIASWADALAATGSEVYLRPMHEMNGDWYPWGATVGDNTPALYIKAWRHLHDVFAAHGATNVKFVWCPLPSSSAGAAPLEAYYPGADYVDVLSLDGYNWGSEHADFGGWQSFGQVFGDAYRRLTKLGSQPIWFAEVGSAPTGGDKAAWVKDMWKTARTMPRLKALVWFDQDKEEDWRALPVASAFKAG